MRVLVVGHNVFSKTNNMGKTLLAYFGAFLPGELAQFYIQNTRPEVPDVCSSYFRITDREMLRAVLSGGATGGVFSAFDAADGPKVHEDGKVVASMYQRGKKRTSGVYALREALWNSGRWKSEKLKEWVKGFDPECVFFASGDYAFMYDIAVWIADLAGCPLIVSCVDDFYVYNSNMNSLLGRRYYKYFMKKVRKTMKRASLVTTICEPMKKEYELLFGKQCVVLHTPAENHQLNMKEDAINISYVGNLSCGRIESLVEMGKVLKTLQGNEEPNVINVYTADEDSFLLSQIKMENGLRFCGSIGSDGVLEVMKSSLAVVHVESFDTGMMKRTRFSISTKIAESLTFGPCLIAYGPKDIASIEYLERTEAAFVAMSKSELEDVFRAVLSDREGRMRKVVQARAIAQRNHSLAETSERLKEYLKKCVNEALMRDAR